jgi:hypothetical protein
MHWCTKFHMVTMIISIALSVSSGTVLSEGDKPDLGMLTWSGMFIIMSFMVPYFELRRIYANAKS